jgi:hypothetical protein
MRGELSCPSEFGTPAALDEQAKGAPVKPPMDVWQTRLGHGTEDPQSRTPRISFLLARLRPWQMLMAIAGLASALFAVMVAR